MKRILLVMICLLAFTGGCATLQKVAGNAPPADPAHVTNEISGLVEGVADAWWFDLAALALFGTAGVAGVTTVKNKLKGSKEGNIL